jgi:hypothetical protein
VFLVESPFQVLCATEARAAYGIDPDDALAVLGTPSGPEGARQLATVLERGGWRHTASADWDGTGNLAFVGDYRKAWQRGAARAVGDARPKVLDDGNATLLLARRRHRRWWRLTDRSGAWAKGRTEGRPYIPGIVFDVRDRATREHRHLELFSMYHVRQRRTDTWRPNTFDVLRGSAPPTTETRAVYIGTNLPEQGLVLEGALDERLRAAAEQHGPGLLYVAHRVESDAKLNAYRERFGVEVVRPDGPIEVFLLDRGIRPDPLVGTLSSAFDSLRVVFPGVAIDRRPPLLDEVPRAARRSLLRLVELADAATIVASATAPRGTG